jgi:hypothetical protein
VLIHVFLIPHDRQFHRTNDATCVNTVSDCRKLVAVLSGLSEALAWIMNTEDLSSCRAWY